MQNDYVLAVKQEPVLEIKTISRDGGNGMNLRAKIYVEAQKKSIQAKLDKHNGPLYLGPWP